MGGRGGVGWFYSWKRLILTLRQSSFWLTCSAFTLHRNGAEHTRVRKFCDLLWWSDIGTVMLCSISFSGCQESPISCGWGWGRPFGQVAIFLLFQEFGEALNLSLSKSFLEWGLPSLQLLRIAQRKYHLSQGDLNGGFPVWTPTLNSLETEVLGIVFYIDLAQTFIGSYFPQNLFEKDSCLIPLDQHVIKLGKDRAN